MAVSELPKSVSHPFYEKLNGLLAEHRFDEFVEGQCRVFYAEKMERPSLAPGEYFRFLLLGYFECLDSQRAMAWRAADSSGVRAFLGPNVEKLVEQLFSNDYPLRHLRRVQGILRLVKSHPITPEAWDHACQRARLFNKTRLAYTKDCALYFVHNGQRPTLAAPQRKPEIVHLHQLAAQIEIKEEVL